MMSHNRFGHSSASEKNFRDPDRVAVEKHLFSFSYIAMAMLAIFAALNLAVGFYHAVAIDLLGILFFFFGLWIFKNTGKVNAAGIMLISTCCVELILQSIILEPDAFHNMFFFPAVGIFCFALFEDKKFTLFCFFLTCCSAIVSYLIPKYMNSTVWILTGPEKDFYIIASLIGSLAATYKIGAVVYRQKEEAFEKLNLTKEKLVKLNEKNKKLLQLIIHDISNPLISIDFAVRNAANNEGVHGPEKIASLCDPAILTIREIIENAREMMALEDGKIKSNTEPVDLERAIPEALLLVDSLALKKNIKFNPVIRLSPGCRVMVDPKSFKTSVLSNLLSNAVKFSKRGSEIKLEAYEKADKAVLKVVDTGIGMPPNIVERVFDPSFKTSRRGTEGERGTGYGMPLAKAFVESYGGAIECVSQEDVGTLVKLTLRKAPAECEQ